MDVKQTITLIWVLLLIFSCTPKKKYQVEFDNVNGLEIKSDVLYKGFKIGYVSKIILNENWKVIVDIDIYKNYTLPNHARFVLISEGIMGTKAIDIRQSEIPVNYTKGDIIKGEIENRNVIDSLTNKAIDYLKSAANNELKKKDSLLFELQRLNNNLEELKRK